MPNVAADLMTSPSDARGGLVVSPSLAFAAGMAVATAGWALVAIPAQQREHSASEALLISSAQLSQSTASLQSDSELLLEAPHYPDRIDPDNKSSGKVR